ncbi:MAG TPA: efflux RND transporter permease subunit [Vicinamibacterales bacterium]|jgi:HAE1 family hydrophobic/amphiphilic exporter-1|nr:efflux RND transporter permease subunit [Vicinamibacterales bacterium]
MSIPRTAIHRPVTMFMISAVIILIGGISLMRLPVDLMPDVSFPSITVRVGYPGVGPLEIEELIVRPIEQATSAVAGVERLEATASEGNARVTLNFAWGTDLNEAADEVRSRIDRVRARLPEDAEPPTVFKFDSTAFPIMGIGLEGDFDRVTLREIAQNDLSPRLERVPGVAAVTVDGGLRRQIHVNLSKEKITALDLSVDRIVNIIQTENENIPLGEIDEGDTTYLLRSQGQFENLDQIRDLVVMTKNGVPVYMRDIAEVKDATEDFRSFTRINGKPGVRMRVTKQSGENTVQIADAVKAEVERINHEVPAIKLTMLDDQSVFIGRAIDSVKEHAMLGSILVILVIFLFLRDFRATLIVCTSIPISVIGTFALLYFADFTLNTMTFGGLALGIGMIVDAAIVVLENTYRHMEMGKPHEQAAIDGSEEVWSAIVASTLTHIAVFIPLLFLTGVSSILFTQLSIVVIFSLSMSLFVAVTLVPVLCAKWLRLPKKASERTGLNARLFGWSERALESMDNLYGRIVHRSLMHRPTVLAVGAGLFVVALLILPTIGFELMPQTDEGEVRVDAELAVGTRIERVHDTLERLEGMIRREVPETAALISSAGGGGWMGGAGHRGDVTVRLVPRTERTRSNEEIAMALRRALSGQLPGVIIRARPSGGNNQMNRIMGGGGESRLAVEIRGHDLEDAKRLAQDTKAVMDRTPGIADVRVGRDEGRPELAIRVDRPKAAVLGLTVSGVANTIQTNVAGTQAAFFRERGYEYPIVVRLREEDRGRVSDVGDILISTPQGQVLQAKNLMKVESEQGPVQIERKNQERITRVNAELETTLSEAVDAVNERLPDLRVPQDFSVGFGQEVEEQRRAFGQLQLMLILAIVLVYAVMASQYESLKDPFIIMFSVPLAAIGVVLALKLTGTPFSLQAYIGVIMLAGIVVSNAILLVDYTNLLRRRDGVVLRQAVERAGRTRLRPILMTSLCTMLGLVPMSLGIGEGAELQSPLARVVIGGLLTSTLITLVFVPTVYTIFEEGWSGLRRGIHHDHESDHEHVT